MDLIDRGWESPGGASSEESHTPATDPDPTAADNKKTCADCGTSKTPLWRSGPAGPKSLCNACGIRSRKKRRAILGLEDKKVKRSSDPSGGGGSSSSSSGRSVELEESFKRKILAIGKHVAMPRSRRPRKKIGEEEQQAAMLLMALSYGSVYA
ncbi:hypothetical protein MLD38_023587 [Melastoma candidum]|uniref:Uncharacterized protein n=1 Tax=Melastoma candidum TaxID=119954 RepID=A0ACB9NW93_9MYRT|nr:hypothetical protein MLD38_023587 [Melastoma candidum]